MRQQPLCNLHLDPALPRTILERTAIDRTPGDVENDALHIRDMAGLVSHAHGIGLMSGILQERSYGILAVSMQERPGRSIRPGRSFA